MQSPLRGKAGCAAAQSTGKDFMSFVLNDAPGWCLIFLAVFCFSFSLRFHKATVEEAGTVLSPGWFRPVISIGVLVSIALFLSQIPVLGRFLVNVVFAIKRDVSNVAVVLGVVLVGGVCFLLAAFLGKLLRRRILFPRVLPVFDNDVVVQKLLQDIENGATELSIYQTRLEGLRSFRFDIDGYNRPALSVQGCKLLAEYIAARYPDTFTITCCQGYAGEGSGSGVNVVNNGARYRFSHMHLQRR